MKLNCVLFTCALTNSLKTCWLTPSLFPLLKFGFEISLNLNMQGTDIQYQQQEGRQPPELRGRYSGYYYCSDTECFHSRSHRSTWSLIHEASYWDTTSFWPRVPFVALATAVTNNRATVIFKNGWKKKRHLTLKFSVGLDITGDAFHKAVKPVLFQHTFGPRGLWALILGV